jgi:hypothetical protein
MTDLEIIDKAKYYFGKNRNIKRDLVLAYEFKGENSKRWKKEIGSIIENPFKMNFQIFDDIILKIKNNKKNEIDWEWMGDLSWRLHIVLNSNIKRGYDWDKNLAKHCNGTVRILEIFISDVIPCYALNFCYFKFSKLENYYENGPILNFTNEEKVIKKSLSDLLKSKGLQRVKKEFCEKKFTDLYSDTNSDGNASLFDVLFSDTYFFTSKIKRYCDKDILEKSGIKFRWTENYNKNGTLKERTEYRCLKGGDNFKITLDNKGRIINAEVERKKIGRDKFQKFKIDIIESYKARKKEALK